MTGREKHNMPLPSPRSIRRACSNELYRTKKRLGKYIAEEKFHQAVEFYFRKVIENLVWIHQHHSNRKLLADWWDETVSAAIAEMWEENRSKLCRAFRDAFGG
jgi:toxin CptA